MILVFPASMLMADVNSVMLQSKGKVTVNGKAAAKSTAVFAGDAVRTADESFASISTKGSTALLLANSEAKFSSQAVELTAGRAAVTTSNGMKAKAGKLTIAPAIDVNTSFQVTLNQGKVEVVALEGKVSVSDGKQTILLEKGEQLAAASTGMEDVPVAKNSIAAGALIALIAAIAAASAAVAIATTRDKQDTSPSTF